MTMYGPELGANNLERRGLRIRTTSPIYKGGADVRVTGGAVVWRRYYWWCLWVASCRDLVTALSWAAYYSMRSSSNTRSSVADFYKEGHSGGGGAPYINRYGATPVALLKVLFMVYWIAGIAVTHAWSGKPVKVRRSNMVTERIYRSAAPFP